MVIAFEIERPVGGHCSHRSSDLCAEQHRCPGRVLSAQGRRLPRLQACVSKRINLPLGLQHMMRHNIQAAVDVLNATLFTIVGLQCLQAPRLQMSPLVGAPSPRIVPASQ
jgi:hypothetical protein